MTLDELIGKFEDIAINSGGLANLDFFELAKEFFSQDSVKELIVELNRDRLYNESLDNEGRAMPLYAEKTRRHKVKMGLPSVRYTYYETGQTHESLETFVEDTFVMVTPSQYAPEYAQYLLPEAWGISDDDYDFNLRDGLVTYISNGLKEYING